MTVVTKTRKPLSKKVLVSTSRNNSALSLSRINGGSLSKRKRRPMAYAPQAWVTSRGGHLLALVLHHWQAAARQGPRRLRVHGHPDQRDARSRSHRRRLAQRRNAVLVGGTGTGKTHLASAIARTCIRGGRPRSVLQSEEAASLSN